MTGHKQPGPDAKAAAHLIVGAAGSALVHAIVKPKTEMGTLIVWLLGAAFAIWLHAKLDMPVAKVITALA